MNIKHKLLSSGAIALLALQSSNAFGLAGDIISNQAEVFYSVSGIPQTEIPSSPTGNADPALVGGATTFAEDRFLNFTLISTNTTAPVPVTPGQDGTAAAGPIATFTITNNGNDCQDFDLSTDNVASATVAIFGGSFVDTFDTAGTLTTLVDATYAGPVQTYDGDEPVATFVDQLCPTEVATVFVVPVGTDSIPTSQVNGDIALVSLVAEIFAGSGTTPGDADTTLGAALPDNDAIADTPAGVENVYATTIKGTETLVGLVGSENLGERQAGSGFIVEAAELITTKVSIVTDEGTNQTTPTITADDLETEAQVALGDLNNAAAITHGDSKRISDAVVAYVIEVQNDDEGATGTTGASGSANATDAADATDVFIFDDLSALVAASGPFVDAVPTVRLLSDNGGTPTAVPTAAALTTLPAGLDLDDDTTFNNGVVGQVYYDATSKKILGVCGILRGNDGAGATLNEACRLVINMTLK